MAHREEVIREAARDRSFDCKPSESFGEKKNKRRKVEKKKEEKCEVSKITSLFRNRVVTTVSSQFISKSFVLWCHRWLKYKFTRAYTSSGCAEASEVFGECEQKKHEETKKNTLIALIRLNKMSECQLIMRER